MPASLERILDARGATRVRIAPDESWLCYVTDVTGTPQLWRLPTGQEGLAPRPAAEKAAVGAGGEVKLGDIKPTTVADGRMTFVLDKINVPGNDKVVLSGKGDGTAGNAPRTEERAFSFNVDTNAEGNLQRATRDQLDGAAPGAQLHTPGDDTALKKVLANRPAVGALGEASL